MWVLGTKLIEGASGSRPTCAPVGGRIADPAGAEESANLLHTVAGQNRITGGGVLVAYATDPSIDLAAHESMTSASLPDRLGICDQDLVQGTDVVVALLAAGDSSYGEQR